MRRVLSGVACLRLSIVEAARKGGGRKKKRNEVSSPFCLPGTGYGGGERVEEEGEIGRVL